MQDLKPGHSIGRIEHTLCPVRFEMFSKRGISANAPETFARHHFASLALLIFSFGLFAFIGIADEMLEGDTLRVDRWLLLALRMAAVSLLAVLFARPFLFALQRRGDDRLVVLRRGDDPRRPLHGERVRRLSRHEPCRRRFVDR